MIGEMISRLKENLRDARIDQASHAAARAIQAQIYNDEQPPYIAHAHVRGMTPEDTVTKVGQRVIDIIGGQVGDEPRYFVDTESVQADAQRVRVGAMIRLYPAEYADPRTEI